MSQIEIIGIAVIGLTAVITLVSAFIKLIVTPVNELSLSISKLDSTLDKVNCDQIRLENRVNHHGDRLDSIDIKLASNSIN